MSGILEAMKHHLYQIYYGGFKIKLSKVYYCKQCKTIIITAVHVNAISKKEHYKLNLLTHPMTK